MVQGLVSANLLRGEILRQLCGGGGKEWLDLKLSRTRDIVVIFLVSCMS